MIDKPSRRAAFEAGMGKRLNALRELAEIEAKASVTATGTRGWLNGQSLLNFGPKKEDLSNDAMLASLYSKTELVFACIRELTTSAAEAPLQIGTLDAEDEFTPIPNHPLLEVFTDDPRYSYNDHINLDVSRLYLTGMGASQLDVNLRGEVVQKTPMPTQAVTTVSKGPEIVRFDIDVGKEEPLPLDPSEVCYHRILDPGQYQGYVSPLGSAYLEYLADKQRAILTTELMRNRNLPGGFIETDLHAKAKRDQIADTFDTKTGSQAGNRGRVIALPPGAKFKEGVDVKDIDFSALSQMTETRICMVFGVHPVIIAAQAGLDRSTFNNYGEARTSFYRETILTLWGFLASGYTRCMLRAQGIMDLVVRFDTSNIAELQEDRSELSEHAERLWSSQLATLNESRSIVGLDPRPDGDEFKEIQAPPAFGQVVAEQEPGGDGPPQANDDDEGKTLLGDYAGVFAHKDGCGCNACKIEAKAEAAIGSFIDSGALEGALQGFFSEQGEAVAKTIKVGDELIDLSTWDEALADTLRPILGDIYETYGQRAFDRVMREAEGKTFTDDAPPVIPRKPVRTPIGTPTGGSFELVRAESLELLEAQIQNFAKSVNLTTTANLERAIQRVLETAAGTNTVPDLAAAVMGVFENASDARARVIAITESSRAQHDSQILAGAKTGLVIGYRTLVSGDACPICQYIDAEGKATGVAVIEGQSMESAVEGIGAYGSPAPPFHPNCRCTQVEVLIGEELPQPSQPQPGWTYKPRPTP